MKSSPKPPPAPDPVATANAQAQMNKETAVAQANLNRIDQYTPTGSMRYSQIGTNPDGTPQYRQDVELSAVEQQKLNQANEIALAMGNLATSNIDRVRAVQTTPFDYSGAPQRVNSVTPNSPMSRGPTSGYSIQNSIDGYGDVQEGLDFGSGALMPTVDALNAAGGKAYDAVYKQYASRLDPQWQQRESDARARLSAQGISENSDAFRREMDNMGRDRNDAYGQAMYMAQQAGSQEQSRLLDLALRSRGQNAAEVSTAGNFRNAAQDQQYNQALAIAELYNNANQQRFSQDQATAAFGNQVRAQEFNEGVSNANMTNAGREAAIMEEAYKRNLPLNEIAALLGTGGVNMPEFNSVPQVGVAAPDYQGVVMNNYNNAMRQYESAMAARSQGLGSIFGAAGSLGGAAILSDMRLKTAIRRIGTLANGLATYAFKYIGSAIEQFGVMAQDVLKVRPDAVHTLPSGYLAVDYRKVYA
ncbi:MAG: tail fiber domain-containing protein [Hyphomicrobiaceae bacterium]|nr:MAG: tail fiber domain-containing protein [Hyphomicrobiaceae bacterium]